MSPYECVTHTPQDCSWLCPPSPSPRPGPPTVSLPLSSQSPVSPCPLTSQYSGGFQCYTAHSQHSPWWNFTAKLSAIEMRQLAANCCGGSRQEQLSGPVCGGFQISRLAGGVKNKSLNKLENFERL